jgi:uncharacterized membrane protein
VSCVAKPEVFIVTRTHQKTGAMCPAFVFRRCSLSRSPRQLIFPIIALGVLAILVQFQVLTIAFGKLGLSAQSAYLLLLMTLSGSLLNIPLFTIDSNFDGESGLPKEMLAWAQQRRYLFPGKTLILANVGGCIVPVAFCV